MFNLTSFVNCRACAESKSIKDMIYLFNDETIPGIFFVCTSLEIQENDHLPAHICQGCNGQLLEFYEFRKKCLATDSLHRDSVNMAFLSDTNYSTTNTPPIKEEQLVDIKVECTEPEVYDVCFAEPLHNDFNTTENVIDVIIKSEDPTELNETNGTEIVNNNYSDSENSGVNQIYEADNEPRQKHQCKICHRTLLKEHQLKAHMREHQGLLPYECRQCKKTYTLWKALKDHIMSKHAKNPIIKPLNFHCKYEGCDKKYASQQKISEHYTKFHKNSETAKSVRIPTFHCKYNGCDKKYASHQKIAEHVTKFHSTSANALKLKKRYICDFCGKQFWVKHLIEGHVRRHAGLRAYECVPCNKTFHRYSAYWTHTTVEHNRKEKPPTKSCKGCDKIFSTSATLKQHYEHVHLGKPRSLEQVCETCGKTFTNIYQLRRHNYIHLGYENYPYPCKVCPKKFVSEHTLKIHKLRHDGIRKHICPICGVPKTTTAELKHHIDTHSTEKSFQCEKCTAAFASLRNLKRHIKNMHLLNKPHTCTYCGLNLKNYKSLKHHNMIHTGEKPHACTICDKRFIQKTGLKLHMQTHMKHGLAAATKTK